MAQFFASVNVFAERRGRMVYTPASCWEMPGSNIGQKTSYPD